MTHFLFNHPTYESVPGYWKRHEQALTAPNQVEGPIVLMLKGWLEYADHHENRYDSRIGEDGVIGPAWAEIGKSLLNLLNGELSRLDGGALDALIRNTLTDEGFELD